MKFRYWNDYKYTNKYKTKSYFKKSGIQNKYITTTNWIPYSAKIYTKGLKSTYTYNITVSKAKSIAKKKF